MPAKLPCPPQSPLVPLGLAILDDEKVKGAVLQEVLPKVGKSFPSAIVKRRQSKEALFGLNQPKHFPKAIIEFRKRLADLAEQKPASEWVKVLVNDLPVATKLGVGSQGGITELVAFDEGHTYADVSDKITNFAKENGLKDADVANDIMKTFKGEEITNGDDAYKQFLARTTYLLFVTESSRNPATLLTTPMMLDMVSSGDKSFKEFLNDPAYKDEKLAGGLFPMSFVGAVPASRSVGSPYPGPTGSRKEVAQYTEREAEFLEAWAEKQGIDPTDQAAVMAAAKDFADKTYGLGA